MTTIAEVINDTKNRMEKTVGSLERDLGKVRTGRASESLVDTLLVNYYGSKTSLNQLASISVPEARTIVIQPWDKEAISDIEKSISLSDLGFNPISDGDIIRINVPELTEERRKEMVKLVGGVVEQANVATRNIRRDSLETFRSMEKDKEISQDDLRKAQTELQKVTDSFSEEIDLLKSAKEKEVMQV